MFGRCHSDGPRGAGIEGDLTAAKLAQARGATLVLDVLDIEQVATGLCVQRDLGRGAREIITLTGPAVLLIAEDAPQPMYVSRFRQLAASPNSGWASEQDSPTRPKLAWEPVRLRTKTADLASKTGGAAWNRMFETFGLSDSNGDDEQHVVAADTETCAQHLVRYLAHHGFIADREGKQHVEPPADQRRKQAVPDAPTTESAVTPATAPIRAPHILDGPTHGLQRRPRPYRPTTLRVNWPDVHDLSASSRPSTIAARSHSHPPEIPPMAEFEYLFTPIKIGPCTIKNRICCAAHADALAEDGMPGERERRYYEEKAIGGVGFMMCFGSASVHPTSTARDWNGVEIFDDRVIPYLQKFSDTMHQYDVPVCCQITHRGRRGRSIDLWNRMYGPSDAREPNHRENPHPLDPEMIDELVESFAAAAYRLKEGGFDGCEIMASHCHLIDQFFTPNANKRDDAYGANSIESRMKFGVRVIEAVREKVGSDFIVGTRITGDDLTERGLDNAQMQDICGRLNDLKMLDYFNVIGGSPETFFGEAAAVPNMSFKLGLYTYLAASIRQVVDVPVIAFGRIVDPVQADKVLAAGEADMVIMNRSLIADPHLPNKAQAGQLDEIRQCMGYNEGCIDRIYTGRGVTCVQNPVIGREAEWATVSVTESKRTLVVVGGGPAGLEAARVAALQGHRVVLFEKSDQLGGQTLIAKRAPSRQDFDGATRWSSQQCYKLGVDIRLNTPAGVDEVAQLQPDHVFVATGATARPHDLQETAGHPVFSAWDVLLDQCGQLGKTLLVIDEEYGFQGPTTAAWLLERGHEVDLITSQETIGNFLGATTRPPLLTRLFKQGIQMFHHLKAVRLETGHCIAANQWTGELHQVGPYDGFVYAYGGISVDEISKPLQEQGFAVETIGDAFAPRTLQHAILEGHQAARLIR